MSSAPELSIIIVTYNSANFLERCLASFGQCVDVRFEVCVVDNASEDGSVEYLKKNHPEVTVIVNPRNRGFAAAINQGLAATSAPFVLWLNPDTEFLKGHFSQAIRFMEQNPENGILGLKILNPDGSIQLSCRSFPSYETALFNRYSLLTRLFPANPFSRKYLRTDWDHQTAGEADWVSGACLLHRRTLIRDTGLLDERFFMYSEDVDFCKRAGSTGWKVLYYPDVNVLHHIAGSSRLIPWRMILERHRSMWAYYQKHFNPNPLKDLAVGAGIIVRGILVFIMEFFKKTKL